MEVKIGHRAHAVLNRNHEFKRKLIDELTTQQFANLCFIEGPGRDGFLEIKCLGGEGVLIPESSFNSPGTLADIIGGLTLRMK